MTDDRIAAGLWIEAKLRELEMRAVSYYIVNKGAYFSGDILLKLNGLNGVCRLSVRERNASGELVWVSSLGKTDMLESEAEGYISRALQRDRDLWVIEIETRGLVNEFES